MISLVIAALLALLFRRMWKAEPRRLRTAVVALLAGFFAVSAVSEIIAMLVPGTGYILLIVLLLFPFSILALSGVLICNGLQMFQKEGRSLGNSLSLLVGIALLAAPLAALGLVLTFNPLAITTAMLLFLVCAHLGLSFAVFLTFARLYAHRRPRPNPDAVVVLGSRLIRGGVPPLLSARLDRGREEFEGLAPLPSPAEAPHSAEAPRPSAEAPHPSAEAGPRFIVPTGGQGPDESRSEGAAMAEYLEESGVPAEAVLVEDRARTTEENLRFSRALVDAQGVAGGQLLVVTNGYHVPRAALLSRAVGIDADAVGAKTARYFVPSAFLREFVAVMKMHLRLHVLLLLPWCLLCVGVGWLLVQAH